MKKILILSTSPIKKDGLSKLIFEILKYNNGHYIFELAAQENIDYNNEIAELRINGHVLPKKKNLIKYMSTIYSLIKNNNYDIVYIHGNSAMMFFEAFAAKMTFKSKIVTHCHSSSSDYKILHHIIKPFFNILIDRKIGCSSLASNWAYMGKNIVTIPNGIDVNKFLFNIDLRREARRELRIEDDEVLIGNVGRFSVEKNHKFLLDIFNEYQKRNQKSKLIIIGQGNLKDAIIKEAERFRLKDKIIIIEYTEDVERYYNAMDIMIMPSIFEGLSLVALEAQANSLPIVVSDAFGEETFVTKFISKESLFNDASKWADKIKATISNVSRGDKIDEHVKNILSEEEMMRLVTKELEGVLSK